MIINHDHMHHILIVQKLKSWLIKEIKFLNNEFFFKKNMNFESSL